jgi:peptidoglycan hydrolase-like protein with peptidoglycan-binding domain
VRLLQRLLRERGYFNGAQDGIYNARLQQAVRRFQQDNGIFGSGVVDARTWNLLGVFCGSLPPIFDGMPTNSGISRGLRQVLSTNRRVYRQGQTVQIALNKTNVTNDPIQLRYNSSQLIEIVIRDMFNREVWRYSFNRSFNPFTRLITIMPDGTQTINESWGQTNNNRQLVMPGVYTITTQNLATGLALSVQIEII